MKSLTIELPREMTPQDVEFRWRQLVAKFVHGTGVQLGLPNHIEIRGSEGIFPDLRAPWKNQDPTLTQVLRKRTVNASISTILLLPRFRGSQQRLLKRRQLRDLAKALVAEDDALFFDGASEEERHAIRALSELRLPRPRPRTRGRPIDDESAALSALNRELAALRTLRGGPLRSVDRARLIILLCPGAYFAKDVRLFADSLRKLGKK